MNQKSADFQSKYNPLLTSERIILDHFGGRKNRFLEFFKVVLEFFRKCLSIVLGLNRTTFDFVFSPTMYFLLPVTESFLWGSAKP